MFPSLLRQGEMFQENLIVQTWVYGVFVSLEWVGFFFCPCFGWIFVPITLHIFSHPCASLPPSPGQILASLPQQYVPLHVNMSFRAFSPPINCKSGLVFPHYFFHDFSFQFSFNLLDLIFIVDDGRLAVYP